MVLFFRKKCVASLRLTSAHTTVAARSCVRFEARARMLLKNAETARQDSAKIGDYCPTIFILDFWVFATVFCHTVFNLDFDRLKSNIFGDSRSDRPDRYLLNAPATSRVAQSDPNHFSRRQTRRRACTIPSQRRAQPVLALFTPRRHLSARLGGRLPNKCQHEIVPTISTFCE